MRTAPECSISKGVVIISVAIVDSSTCTRTISPGSTKWLISQFPTSTRSSAIVVVVVVIVIVGSTIVINIYIIITIILLICHIVHTWNLSLLVAQKGRTKGWFQIIIIAFLSCSVSSVHSILTTCSTFGIPFWPRRQCLFGREAIKCIRERMRRSGCRIHVHIGT